MIPQLSLPQLFAIWALPVLFAITVHEVAHGWVASKLGDKTALMLGRLTLNPSKHIDPFGTILVPSLLLFLGAGFIFGWAKPVPVTWANLKHPKRDIAIVALAGPVANLLMACGWALVTKLGIMLVNSGAQANFIVLIYMGQAGVMINLILGVLNLLPLPPLDGSRIASSLLPRRMAMQYDKLEPYGLFILLGLLVLGVLGNMLLPPIRLLYAVLASVFGLS